MSLQKLFTLFFRTSVYERDSRLRSALAATAHTSLLWGGILGVVAIGLYFVINTVVLGHPTTWTFADLGAEPRTATPTLLCVALVSGGLVVLAWMECSLLAGRLGMAVAILIIGGVTIYDGTIDQGRVTDYLGLVYLVGVAAMPFRPWQVLCIGGGLAVLLYGIGSTLVPLPLFDAGDRLPHLMAHMAYVGLTTPVLTGVSAILYLRHRDRVASQAELTEERDRLRTLLDALPVPVIHGRPHGGTFEVLTVNPAFEEVFGASVDRGANLHDIIVPGGQRDEARRIDRQLVEQGTVQTEVRRQTADGTLRDFRVEATVRPPADGPLEAYAVYIDITDRKHHEQQLQQAKAQAEEAARLKSAMLANVSHEIRTPLTSITGFAEVLEEELNDQPQQFASMILRSGERLMETIQSVLQLSKLDAGAYTLDYERVCLHTQVEETLQMMAPKAEEAGVTLETDLSDPPVEGYLDASAFDRILSNLVGNAVKYTDAGGRVAVRVREETRSVNGTQSPERGAVVEVEDTGIGISADLLPNIFQAFRQESEGISRSHEGSGLGLTIVQKLVDAHGGTIDVESEKGVGSRFTVRLPLDSAPEA
jgi:PAS domain S-box-containing protein